MAIYPEEDIQAQKEYYNALLNLHDTPENLDPLDVMHFEDCDNDKYLAFVTRDQVIKVLEYFIDGKFTNKDLYDWANAILFRPTLVTEAAYEGYINDILMPIIPDYAGTKEAMTLEQAQEELEELKNAQPDITEDDEVLELDE